MAKKKQDIPPSTGRVCDHPDCTEEGLYRAPKDRTLKTFYWFCLKHVQEYNKNWNYYEGLSEAQIEQELQADMVGHRPTWKVNDLYSRRIFDPFNLFDFGGAGKKTKQELPFEATIEHLEAIRVLSLQTPVTKQALKKRYKELAKLYHPDKTGGDRNKEEKFKQMTEAYHLLMKVL